MIDQIILFMKGLDQRTLIMGVSIVLLWVFLKGIRFLIHCFVAVLFVGITLVEVPAVKDFLASLIS